MRIQRRRLNQRADATHQRAMIAVERLTEQPHLACVRPDETEQHSDRCRLTRAIWTKEAIDARRGYEQVQIINSELGSETSRQPARLDQVVICLRHLKVNEAELTLLTLNLFLCFVPFYG